MDLLAQATAIDPGVASLIGQCGVAAVLAWYVINDVRVRTPNMLAAFSKEQAELRATFAVEQAKERESNRSMVESIRQTFVTEQGALRQAFSTEQGATRQAHEIEQSKLREMLLSNLLNMRQAVHDVKETAQCVMGGSHQEHRRADELGPKREPKMNPAT